MKSFLNFLTEATESQAAMQAKKLGLKGDGHGGWIDRAGKVVARTEKGKLKFTEKRTSKGQEEPEADTQKSAAPETKPKQKQHKHLHQNLKHQKNQHLKINHKKLHHSRLYLVDLIHQQ
jgi:hypothetical protein